MTDETRDTTRRSVLKGLAGAAGVASLAGCTSRIDGIGLGGGDGKQSVRYAQVLSPVTLDPVEIDDPWSAQVAGRVFDGLYTFGSGTDVVPRLARGPPETDEKGTTYTVELREDAAFHNSDSITAADVRYSFEAPVHEETPPKWAFEPIEEIRTPDEHTVEFHLAHPYPAFRYVLTQPIVPKSERTANPEEFGKDPVGSGPFEATQFKEGKYAVLEKWDGYWGETTPEVDTVTFAGNHSGLARTMSLRSEQNEIVERVQPKLWEVTEEMPETNVSVTKSYDYFYVGFNCNAGPTEEAKVRRAIDYLIDTRDLVEHFVDPSEQGTDPDSHIVDSGPEDDTEWRQFSPLPEQLAREWEFPVERWREIPRRKNPQKAKTLLKEADFDSWQPKIVVPEDMLREKFADAIVHELSSIGYKRARTKKYPWETYREKLRTGSPSEYHMFVGSWSGWPDPDSFVYPLFHENNEGLTNFTFYQDEQVMEQIARARKTANRAERKKLYERSITKLLEERVHLPAFTLHNTFGTSTDLEGFDPHPISSVNPRFVGLDGSSSLSK